LDDPEKAKHYRERAADILAWAAGRNEEQRRILLAIAAMYHRLAAEFEDENASND
jgi:hypothetical protein